MKRKLVALLISVAAVAAFLGLAAVVAAPRQSVDRSEAMAALAVLNRYFSETPLADVGTSPPASTATPTATPTPAPKPTPIPLLTGCLDRTHGAFNRGFLNVVRQVKRHVDVTYINEPHKYAYGFRIRNSYSLPEFTIRVTPLGEWVLARRTAHGAWVVSETGILANHSVPFNTGEGERNQLTYFEGDGLNRSFWVNGVKVPVDFAALRKIGSGDRYESSRMYRLYYHGTQIHPQRYENLCTVNSW